MEDRFRGTNEKRKALEEALIALCLGKNEKIVFIQTELLREENLIKEKDIGITELKAQAENCKAAQKKIQALLDEQEKDIQAKELKINEQVGLISSQEREKAGLVSKIDEYHAQIEKNDNAVALIKKQKRGLIIAGGLIILLAAAFAAWNCGKGLAVKQKTHAAVSSTAQAVIDEMKKQKGITVEQNKDIAENNEGEERITITAQEEAIYFVLGKTEVKPQSAGTLKKIAMIIRKIPKVKVEIIGHTDNTGDKEFNRTLSVSRAKAVSAYFTEKEGLNPEMITTEGYGADKPIASNNVPEGRVKNRRVEIVLKTE
ncbi:MAG: OmpA family protein [Elusimicrobiota bacterium]|nr:OmpA family protein [Elusimicrobiota bacterium]